MKTSKTKNIVTMIALFLLLAVTTSLALPTANAQESTRATYT
jgi:hypothetical protein